MFDDNMSGGGGEPPKNLPMANEPDDIFAKTDDAGFNKETEMKIPEAPSALDNGILKKADSGSNIQKADLPKVSTMPSEGTYETKEPIIGKIFIILIILAAAAGLGYGAWRFYVDYTDNSAQPMVVDEIQMTSQYEDSTEPEEANMETEPEVIEGEGEVVEEITTTTFVDDSVLDDDKDSLNNAREKELGTNPNLADTDNDNLRDGDEVLIWQTDPLNPDSDGDGYLDGDEIKNGYNPRGDGKLFEDTSAAADEEGMINI